MKRFSIISVGITALVLVFGLQNNTIALDQPIDALSIHMPSNQSLSVRGKMPSGWTDWQELHIENEQDPTLRESNLVMFPSPVTDVEFSSSIAKNAVHAISISHAPVRYEVAARNDPGVPRILTRAQWGADNSLLYTSKLRSAPPPPTQATQTPGDNGGTQSEREKECADDQRNFPNEFKVERTVRRDDNGELLRWAHEYSKEIKLLVVHHTAIPVTGDMRPGAEKVRALYTYHADNRGWGDIGYHYVVDDAGQIYEGKAGGDLVVGGHAYCHNVDTIGIALLGNFENEKPTQAQMKSLQWLLYHLVGKYQLDMSKTTAYHGANFPPIVGHGDLLKTDCPGYYVKKTLDQVRTNVIRGDLTTGIDFPVAPRTFSSSSAPYVSNADRRLQTRVIKETKGTVPIIREGVSPLGSTLISGRPADIVRFSLRFIAGTQMLSKRSEIAKVQLSDPTAALWQQIDGVDVPVSNMLLTPDTIPTHGSILIPVKVQLPINATTATLTIGDTTYTLVSSGRRQLGPNGTISLPTQVMRSMTKRNTPAQRSRNTEYEILHPEPSSSASTSSSAPASPPHQSEEQFDATKDQPAASNEQPIRILLSYWDPTATVSVNGGPQTQLTSDGYDCIATQNGSVMSRGIVRINGGNNTVSIDSWNRAHTHFRGIIECRIIDGQLTLINELSLEDYMAGLAEEPDTELYEKQRAFAIAARTYAAYYMNPANRKFKGMPYDGSDSPATFQKYAGADFAITNRRWAKAVIDTKDLVLKKNSQIIKPPYFSSDDGRTRTPAEAKWGNFPFAEIFSSKPDPWCVGMSLNGHGVGMSGCGAKGQAKEGKTGEEILQYYYPTTTIEKRE